MSLTKFTGATNWIRSLINKPTKPASELKEDFDKAGDLIKTYINETLTEEIDTQLENKANNSDVYSKTEANTLLGEKANSADVYTKAESDNLLNNKANKKDVYTKTESDNLLNDKANSTDLIKYKLNGDFAVLTGTADFSSRNSKNISYPEGFTKDNCIAISLMLNYQYTNFRTVSSAYIEFSQYTMIIYDDYAYQNRYNHVDYKVVLMKIS